MTQPVFVCPKCGQPSSESDFCSECGSRIGAGGETGSSFGVGSVEIASTVNPGAANVPAGPDECPACHTSRPSLDARFCEVCRYDFLKQGAGDPPVSR